MSEKWCQSEKLIVINDKSQVSIGKLLRKDESLSTRLSLSPLVKEFL